MNKAFRADLHCHTSCSDGTLSPQELIKLAKQIGLSAISITDHDTVLAYETAVAAAKEEKIILGTGVELSCHFEGMNVHLLGYDFHLESQQIKKFCETHKKRREDRNQRILHRLSKLGMPIEEKELLHMQKSGGSIGRPHIAALMVAHKYVDKMQTAFDLYLGEGKAAYDAGIVFSVDETIEVIHGSGGKAFLAHPHFLPDQKKVNELLKKSFDGMECYYGKLLPGQEKKWVSIAKKKNWLISGGSDFHGENRSFISLGCSWVDEETFYRIFEHGL